jgi:transglutaminase-like putative cysteine protease
MTGGETARRGLALDWDGEAAGRAAFGLLARLRPNDGWLALTLLAANLCVVVLSVEQADWAPTPNLAGILLLGMLTAFVFYRLPVWWWLAILPGLVLGGLTVIWQLSNFTFDGQPLGGASVLLDRLGLWLEAAREGSINIDKAPFAFGLVTASWLMGYLGAWLFLRHRNFWGVFALGGLGLFSNLTFLPPNTSLHLALYLFTALLLVARIQAVRRQSHWERRGIRYDEGLRVLTMSDSFFLAIAVIAVAFLFPAGGAWSTATGAYESLRKPLVGLEDDFNRLFAGLPARRDIGFRVWDDVMAFQGTISPATTHTLLVESPVPMYWKARTYDTYTGKGWISEHTEFKPLDYTPEFSTSAPPQSRVTASYVVTPLYASQYLFAGPRVSAVDRDVEIETPSMPVYRADLTSDDPLAGYPPALAEAGRALAERAKQGSVASKAELSEFLPPDFRVGEIEREEGRLVAVTLEEALPNPPDTLAVRSQQGVFAAHDPYIVTSSVPAAEPEQLREAGTDYPVHILDRYTQLPPDLPGRVGGLAREITVNAETPYEKALRVEANLQRLPYSLEVNPPPFNSDGVDFFLFDQRQGYSEYFASAMAVLLRTEGVPARVAVGYTTGDPTEVENLYAVTDSHSHAWVEVYFPGYSWIPFEPTPGAQLPVVMMPGGASSGEFSGPFFGGFDFDCIDEFVEECLDYAEPLPGSAELPEEQASEGFASPWIWIVVVLGIVAAAILATLWAFRRYMFAAYDPSAVYTRVQALSALGGLSGGIPLTPYQFGERLASLLPIHRQRVDLIIGAYVQARYGARTISPERQNELADAWLNLRFPLLVASLGQRIYPRIVT